MRNLRRSRLLLLASVFLAAVPVAFGLIRAVSTSSDVRYLWLAGAAILGSMLVMPPWRGVADSSRVLLRRALGAVAAGAIGAATIAVLMGAKAGPGVAIVAVAFGFCTGASALCATLARQAQAR
jgi:hypothetical protein